MAGTSMRALLEAGVHFGHRTGRWNPKMESYIFTERNGVHIIDLQQTIRDLEEACVLVRDTVADGGLILFVGTKRQAQEIIEREAERCDMPYVNQRWLGGTLTNWRTIRQRIDYLLELEDRRDRGEFDLLTKKEAIGLEREITRLNNRLGGIKRMERLPDLLYVVDVMREETAVKEANKLEIPVVAIVDTNCDPDIVDYLVPANDDAIRSIRLITGLIADSVLEGRDLRESREPEEVEAEMEALGEEDEKYLSAATLARLKELSFDDEEEEEEGETAPAEEEGEEAAESQPDESEEAETD
ncbi:MAG: 30S ribosomal protein S2 [Anaerolineae bacterium]|jgi:small subunit ribosomal protein S2